MPQVSASFYSRVSWGTRPHRGIHGERGGAASPPGAFPSSHADLGERPPRPTADEVRKVISTFPARGGCSYDAFAPGDFNIMTDEGIEALIDIIMRAEAAGEWPDFIIRLVFIPKREGGVRPIALLAAIVRVQGRLRRPIAAEREQRNHRYY